MKGIYKIQGAANTAQARRDYNRLVEIAKEVGRPLLVPTVRSRAGWRVIDHAAGIGVKNLLREFPDLRERLLEIYPGFTEAPGE